MFTRTLRRLHNAADRVVEAYPRGAGAASCPAVRLGTFAMFCVLAVLALCATSDARAQSADPKSGTSGLGAPGSRPSAGGKTSANGKAAPDVIFSESGTISLNAQGADLRQVLQLLSSQSKVNIVATKEVSGTVTADLYDVTFTEALDAVLASAGFAYVRKGNFIYVYTQKQFEEIHAATKRMEIKVYHLNYVTAADAKTLVTAAVSKDGLLSLTPAAAVGVGTSKDTAGGNSMANEDVLVVRDYPENIEKITQMLRELDVPPQQVQIEATLLRATLDENNALGIDFNVLGGVDFRTLDSDSPAITSITPGDVPTEKLDNRISTFRTDFNAGVPKGGLSIGFISNNVAFFIRALETVTDVAVLANPKLLVMNKQRGEVMVGNRDGYLTTTVTETTATQSVEFLETGTRLVVRPYIYSDGFVRLEVHPEDSTGGINAEKLPFEQTTEVTTNVRVRDGHTIVIGGLFRERTSLGRSQVPGLGNIPLAGYLFKQRNDVVKREEVIILITPHIVKQAAAEEVGEHYQEQVERFCVGMRQGLMWFGRDRLAQSHMRWARQHMSEGDAKKAVWDLNMALSLEPRMEEAIRLKERLTKQAIWVHESRYSDAQRVVQRAMMQEIGMPLNLAIPPLKPQNPMDLDARIRAVLGIGEMLDVPLSAYGLGKDGVAGELPGAVVKVSAPESTTMPATQPVKKE